MEAKADALRGRLADRRRRCRLPGLHAPAPLPGAPARRPGSTHCLEREDGAEALDLSPRARSSRPRSSSAAPSTSAPGTTRLYSLALRGSQRPRLRWTFTADDEIVAAPAYADGTVYVATSGGSLYALDARTGRQRWRGRSFARFGSREYFYATPTVAYGRVYIGNADGTVYAFGANSGHLLWARHVGTYVYTGAAVWRRTVYVGTWDGYFVALDAATGDVRWRHDSQGGITGGPTVMAGLVYYSSVGRFDQAGQQRHVESGPPSTFALDARSGRLVWRFPDGKFSPIVADEKRVYLMGENRVFALVPTNER